MRRLWCKLFHDHPPVPESRDEALAVGERIAAESQGVVIALVAETVKALDAAERDGEERMVVWARIIQQTVPQVRETPGLAAGLLTAMMLRLADQDRARREVVPASTSVDTPEGHDSTHWT